MKTEETISRILTEFNFDRKTFDEARNELLILCTSSLQLKDKYGENFEEFVNKNVDIRPANDIYWYKGISYLSLDDLFKTYYKEKYNF